MAEEKKNSNFVLEPDEIILKDFLYYSSHISH